MKNTYFWVKFVSNHLIELINAYLLIFLAIFGRFAGLRAKNICFSNGDFKAESQLLMILVNYHFC